ncbi:MAG: PhosphodieSPTER glycosidase [Cyanobacteria bacterium RYN_339]|nr:PhosphodieSPTER glycosidase [Cyanobacteria bacterium RYN_339]
MTTMHRIGVPLLSAALLLSTAGTAGVAAPSIEQVARAAFNPVSIDANKTRIFMPLRNVKVRKHATKITSWQLEVTSDSPNMYVLERAVSAGVLHHLRIQTLEGKTYIHADWRYAAPVDVNVRPGGLEVVFHHQKAEPHWRSIAEGVKFWEGQRWTASGPMRVRALRLDPRRVRLAPAIASPGSEHMGLATVSRLARAHGAIAAVNAGFFSPKTGQPQGMLVMSHNMVSRTMLDRPGIWFDKDGAAQIRVEKPSASVRLDDGRQIRCQAVNEPPGHNRVVLYTAHHGRTTHTFADESRWEYAVAPDGRVVAEGHGNMGIPLGGWVVSGQGTGAGLLKRAMAFGKTVKIQFNLRPEVRDAMGGGPTLLEHGNVHVLARQQHFRPDVAYGRAPRTAVGLTEDGKYMLVCIDGHQPGYSVGATLTELAWTMKDLGATEALNLDGGGSSTLWMQGHTINRPSDGSERPISTALLVVPREAQAQATLERLLASEIKF